MLDTIQDQPIFKSIFGSDWERLPVVMKKHYANRPFSNDVVCVEGKMDVRLGWLAVLLKPILYCLGVLVPYAGNDIPVSVYFRSDPKTDSFCFDREFYFPSKPVFYFRSQLVPQGGKHIIEFMRSGIGWSAQYVYENDKVQLQHQGYVWKLFGICIPLPITFLLGKGYAEEIALSDESFKMLMQIMHPWWGLVYQYKGVFTLR